MIDVQLNTADKKIVDIRVIGVGGGGSNSVNRMVEYEEETNKKLDLVEYIIANTDIQSLENNSADKKIKLGKEGVGAGMDPEKAKQAALSSKEELKAAIKGAQMLFIVAGMGGGTGTGASPEIAKMAKEEGILTVAIVTRPFPMEGRKRMMLAEEGIRQLAEQVDTIIIIENGRLFSSGEKKETWAGALRKADNVLKDAVRSVVEIIEKNSFINTDFADIEKILRNKGYAHMGVGIARGEDRLEKALEMAIQSPLLVRDIRGFDACLYLIKTAPNGLLLEEIEDIGQFISECGQENAEIILGTAEDDECDNDELIITIVAAGFDDSVIYERLGDSSEESEKRKSRNMAMDNLRSKFLPNNSNTEVQSVRVNNDEEARPRQAQPRPRSNSRSFVYDEDMETRAKSILSSQNNSEFDSIFGGDRAEIKQPERRSPKDYGDGLHLDQDITNFIKIDRNKYE